MYATPNRKYCSLIAILVITLILIGSTVSCSNTTSDNVAANPTPEPTNSILGDISRFDPIAIYPDIVKYAGDNLQLSSVTFYYARSDGTLDLNAKYKPHVYYYFFQRMDGPPPDAPPVGAGGKLNEKWYQPVDVDVRGPESAGEQSKLRRYAGQPTNTTQQGIPAPTCSLSKLWSVALEKGAPKNAVATIYYDMRGYSFRISDTSVSLNFNTQCQFTGGLGLTPEPTDTAVPLPTS